MVKVCVHYPVNATKSKECINETWHPQAWIADMMLPFSNDLSLTAMMLSNLVLDEYINKDEHAEIYDKVAQEKRNN